MTTTVSHTYSDDTDLPEGWAIATFRDSSTGPARVFYAIHRGSTVWHALTRRDVENFIRRFSAGEPLPAPAETEPKHEYLSARCYSDGSPLPEGWEIESLMDDTFTPVTRYRGRKGGTVYAEHATRVVVENFIRDITSQDPPVDTALPAEFSQPVTEPQPKEVPAPVPAVSIPPAPTTRPKTRDHAGAWFVVAGVAGLLVGGISVGLVTMNQAPDGPATVTPASCLAAINYGEDLIETYGDGFAATMLSHLPTKAQKLTEANDEAQRLTPLYEAEVTKCRYEPTK